MSISKCILLLVSLTVAVKAKIILHAQPGATTTGNYVVKLTDDTSSERHHELVGLITHKSDDNAVDIDGNYITARLSEAVLNEVS